MSCQTQILPLVHPDLAYGHYCVIVSSVACSSRAPCYAQSLLRVRPTAGRDNLAREDDQPPRCGMHGPHGAVDMPWYPSTDQPLPCGTAVYGKG